MACPRHRFALTLAALLLPVRVVAHELDLAVTLAPPAVVLQAAYGGTEPVPFAKVQIFSPSAASQEFQTGVTDRRGYFSFVPDGPGIWRIVVDDEEGHRRDVPVTIPDPFVATSSSNPGPSRIERALVGLALIVGATGFLYGFKARRSRARSVS